MKNEKFVSVNELSDIFNVSPRWVQQLAQDGIIPKLKSGKYDLYKCSQAYIKFLEKKLAENDSESPDAKREKRRLTKLQADSREIELLAKKAEVISIEQVQYVMGEMLAICTMGLESIPENIAGQLAGMADPADIQKVLLDEIRGIRRATSEAIREFANIGFKSLERQK